MDNMAKLRLRKTNYNIILNSKRTLGLNCNFVNVKYDIILAYDWINPLLSKNLSLKYDIILNQGGIVINNG